MNTIVFFKQQAKHFLKDFQSRTIDAEGVYDYHPQVFKDIVSIILAFDIDEEKPFTLMNAQHIIARLSGFYKWTELIKASEIQLEIGRLLFVNRESYQEKQGVLTNMVESLIVSDWKNYEETYLQGAEDQDKLEIFKRVFLQEGTTVKKQRAPKVVLDFCNDENAQDMICKIMRKKAVDAEKAVSSSIKQKNCFQILLTGWADIALSLWGHADPDAIKEKLDNPIVEVKLSKDKKDLINGIAERMGVSTKKAVLYCMLFELSSLGYHI